MNTLQLLICSILHRKSQKSMAEKLAIPRNTLNRIIQDGKEEALQKIDPDTWGDTMNKYSMPEGFSPESSVQVHIPLCYQCKDMDLDNIMQRLRMAFAGTPLEVNFRMNEIRKYIEDGTEYDDGEINVFEGYFTKAKTRIDEFLAFMSKGGTVPKKYKYWAKHNQETMAILEAAANGGFKNNPSVLQSGVKLVFELKRDIDAMSDRSSELKQTLEFLLITSATQTAEILVAGGYPEFVADMTNIIADTFGKWPSENFKHLMVKAAWPHNQPAMLELFNHNGFVSNNHPIATKNQSKQREAEICNMIAPEPKAA